MQFVNQSGEIRFLSPSAEHHPIAQKILRFGELDEGWHYGEGIAPGQRIIAIALQIHDSMIRHGLLDTNAFAGINGEITVNAYQLSGVLEFTVEEDDSITFVYEQRGCEIELIENLKIDQAIAKLHDHWKRECDSSDFSKRTTLTKMQGALQALPSKLVQKMGAFPSSASTAFDGLDSPFVNISPSTTGISYANLQFSGASRPINFQTITA